MPNIKIKPLLAFSTFVFVFVFRFFLILNSSKGYGFSRRVVVNNYKEEHYHYLKNGFFFLIFSIFQLSMLFNRNHALISFMIAISFAIKTDFVVILPLLEFYSIIFYLFLSPNHTKIF